MPAASLYYLEITALRQASWGGEEASIEVSFVSWITNLTEGHLPTGNRVTNVNLLIRGSLIIPLSLKIPRLNIFSENCEEKFSKNE